MGARKKRGGVGVRVVGEGRVLNGWETGSAKEELGFKCNFKRTGGSRENRE